MRGVGARLWRRDQPATRRRHAQRMRRQACVGLALVVVLLMAGDGWVDRHRAELLLYTPPAESHYRVKPAMFHDWLTHGGVTVAFVGTSRARCAFSAERVSQRLVAGSGPAPVAFNYALDHGQFYEVQHAIREIATQSPQTLIVWGVSDVSFVAEPSLAPAYEWSAGDLIRYLWRGEGNGRQKRAALKVFLEARTGALWEGFGLRRQVRNYLAEQVDPRLPANLRGAIGMPHGVRSRWARENREIFADPSGDAPTERSRVSDGWTLSRWCDEQGLAIPECMAQHAPQPPSDWIGQHGWEVLRATGELVRHQGGRLVLVEMPRPAAFRASVSGTWFAAYRELIATAVERSGAVLLPVPGVEAVESDDYFRDHSHLNTRGREVFSDLVVTALAAEGYLAAPHSTTVATVGAPGGDDALSKH